MSEYYLCACARSLGMRVKFRIGLGVGIKQNSIWQQLWFGLEVVSSPIELEVLCSILIVVSFLFLAANALSTEQPSPK